ncbi:uncharacterized protein BN461_00491 [Bacteroides sp. CAG:1076]|jgi:hypothetical protein|nr:uncharacterized protein BN461_00491 [Bacteroides sp. CAG:1076]
MKKLLLSLYMLSLCYLPSNAQTENMDYYFYKVDSILKYKDSFKKNLDNEILNFKAKLKHGQYPEDIYPINRLLYEAYKTYISDSALVYLNKNIELAHKMRRTDWLQESLIEKSYIYAATGMLNAADTCLQQAGRYPMDRSTKLKYYTQKIYNLSHQEELYNNNCENKISQNCDSILALDSLPDSPYHIWANFYKLKTNNELIPQTISMLRKKIAQLNDSDPWYPHFTFALSYLLIKTHSKECIKYLALSAITDIKNVNRDSPSIMILTQEAYKLNKFAYAYNYIHYVVDSQEEYPSRTRTNNFMIALQNTVDKMRQLSKAKEQANQKYTIALVCFFIILCISSAYIYILLRKQTHSKRELQKKNEELDKNVEQMKHLYDTLAISNQDLQKANKKMGIITEQMLEANYIKETYIGTLFTICSSYITKIQDIRKATYRKLQTKQYEELMRQNDPTDESITHEIQDLYHKFDITFLKIYPNFINDFNQLLKPEERISLKKGELMNTDLRIYALVKLGITSSTKIAEFLHLSPQTVYNARLKMRSRAIESNENFPDRVRQLGKILFEFSAQKETNII